jgi:hypothetical protein
LASPTAAWIATMASIYSLFWLVGYTHAVRHGGLIAIESIEPARRPERSIVRSWARRRSCG